MIRTIVADKTTAIFAAQAITAALFARERTGEGQHIRLAMLDTMIAYLWPFRPRKKARVRLSFERVYDDQT